MKTREQLLQSIKRFQTAFWGKRIIDRPPVSIFSDRLLLPINYLKRDFNKSYILHNDINTNLIYTDYEYESLKRVIFSDDWIPFSSPWRAIPWLEAICGCTVQYSSGSFAPKAFVDSLEKLQEIMIPLSKQWLQCMVQQTKELIMTFPSDCWVSPSILRGPSDVFAAMRGFEPFVLDLYNNSQVVENVAAQINALFLQTLELHFSIVEPKFDGYGHIYGYWAPQKTIVIQEDMMSMCAPQVYRDIFRKYNSAIVQGLGPCVFFHLHSTGFQHYKDVLQIPELAGLELTVEANGPPLLELVPVLGEILRDSRLILFIDGYFDDLPETLKRIPHEGLYLLVSDKFIKSEEEYQKFVKDNW